MSSTDGDDRRNGDGKKRKKSKKRSKYNYNFGDEYPGTHYVKKNKSSHKGLPMPGEMGWNWKKAAHLVNKKRKQPGTISKMVAKMMSLKNLKTMQSKKKGKKKKKKLIGISVGPGELEPEEPLVPKPTLTVQRKGDVFTISINPLKDLKTIKPNEDPYVDCDPIVFRITKQRSPEERAKMEAKRLIKLKKERDAEIRRQLAEATEEICKCAYMDIYCNDLTAIDRVIEKCPAFEDPVCLCEDESLSSLSSNATWDIEYTPPFGCFDLSPRKIPGHVHVETQYDPAHFGGVPPAKSKCCHYVGPAKSKRLNWCDTCCEPC